MKVFYTPFSRSNRPSPRRREDGIVPEPWRRSRYRRKQADINRTAVCEGCAGCFPEIDGPAHDYLTVSAGCWARFGQALALHYSDHRFWPAHQLLTDAYVLQHSRGGDRRSIRSAHVHLAALYAQLSLDQTEARVIALRRALSEFDFNPLAQPWPSPGQSILAVDLSAPDQHLATVKDYAGHVLYDWRGFHDLAERLCKV